MYEDVLAELEPERSLYLAIERSIYDTLFQEKIGKLALAKRLRRLPVFDLATEEVVHWIPQP